MEYKLHFKSLLTDHETDGFFVYPNHDEAQKIASHLNATTPDVEVTVIPVSAEVVRQPGSEDNEG